MTTNITITEVLTAEICINCGVAFAFSETLLAQFKKNHTYFSCPNGHKQGYMEKTIEDKLRAELAEAQTFANNAQQRTKVAEAKAAALETENKHLQTRIRNGVCAYCRRTFVDLQRHMDTKHKKGEGK